MAPCWMPSCQAAKQSPGGSMKAGGLGGLATCGDPASKETQSPWGVTWFISSALTAQARSGVSVPARVVSAPPWSSGRLLHPSPGQLSTQQVLPLRSPGTSPPAHPSSRPSSFSAFRPLWPLFLVSLEPIEPFPSCVLCMCALPGPLARLPPKQASPWPQVPSCERSFRHEEPLPPCTLSPSSFVLLDAVSQLISCSSLGWELWEGRERPYLSWPLHPQGLEQCLAQDPPTE